MAAPNVLQPYIENYTATFNFKNDGTVTEDKSQCQYCFKKELGDLSLNKYCILVKPANRESITNYTMLRIKATTPSSGGILFTTNYGSVSTNKRELNKDITLDITIITDTNQ